MTNSKRIEHDLDNLPNTFRERDLKQILNDLGEEDSGLGYNEVIRTGVFTTKIIVWETDEKLKKRSEVNISRTGAFVDTITKDFYDEETGTSIVATVTATVTRTGNNFVAYVDTTVNRP